MGLNEEIWAEWVEEEISVEWLEQPLH